MMRLAALLAMLAGVVAVGPAQAEIITALTTSGTLVSFDSSGPTNVLSTVTLSGIVPGQTMVGIDYRPADLSLVGLGYNSGNGQANVYTINPLTGATTSVNSFTVATSVPKFAVDFNPAAGAFRVVASTGQNYRIAGGGQGAFNTDAPLNPGTPNVVAVAYNNNFAGTTSTTLFDIESAQNVLTTQGGVGGTPTPNNGQLFFLANLMGVTGSAVSGFDISGITGAAFISTSAGLFSFNTSTGVALSLGNIGSGTLGVLDITAAVPEPGSLALCGIGAAGLVRYIRRRKAK